MADKIMYIPNDYKITPSVDYNFKLKRFDNLISQSIKISHFLGQRIRKRYYNILGTSVINSLISPPLTSSILVLRLLVEQTPLKGLKK